VTNDLGIIDVQQEMHEFVENKILHYTTNGVSMRNNARDIVDIFTNKYQGKAMVGLCVRQVYNLLITNRKSETGQDWAGRIGRHPMGTTSTDDARQFLLHNGETYVPIDGGGRRQTRILIWGHPDLVWKLRDGAVHLFIDGTFCVCPHPFTQCLIIMAYFKGTQMYVPVFYILLDSKLEVVYQSVFEEIVKICGVDGLTIRTVTTGTHTIT
jgi:hypothetical protein